jgi:hypothetical protein
LLKGCEDDKRQYRIIRASIAIFSPSQALNQAANANPADDHRGLLAGGLIAFVTSSVELASTIMLVPRIELGPISYGIYLYMQSPLGRGAGAALGVIAILLVAIGTYLTHQIFGGRAGNAFRI